MEKCQTVGAVPTKIPTVGQHHKSPLGSSFPEGSEDLWEAPDSTARADIYDSPLVPYSVKLNQVQLPEARNGRVICEDGFPSPFGAHLTLLCN
jgi:hypothetical protein